MQESEQVRGDDRREGGADSDTYRRAIAVVHDRFASAEVQAQSIGAIGAGAVTFGLLATCIFAVWFLRGVGVLGFDLPPGFGGPEETLTLWLAAAAAVGSFMTWPLCRLIAWAIRYAADAALARAPLDASVKLGIIQRTALQSAAAPPVRGRHLLGIAAASVVVGTLGSFFVDGVVYGWRSSVEARRLRMAAVEFREAEESLNPDRSYRSGVGCCSMPPLAMTAAGVGFAFLRRRTGSAAAGAPLSQTQAP